MQARSASQGTAPPSGDFSRPFTTKRATSGCWSTASRTLSGRVRAGGSKVGKGISLSVVKGVVIGARGCMMALCATRSVSRLPDAGAVCGAR